MKQINLPEWRGMLTEARADQLAGYRMAELSSHFETCAVGEAMKIAAREHGVELRFRSITLAACELLAYPSDKRLGELGDDFADAINSEEYTRAEELLGEIEVRATLLVNAEHDRWVETMEVAQ